MKMLMKLLRGELLRLVKNKILLFGAIVAILWCLIIGLSESAEAMELIPMLIGLDAAMMSMLLLAASYYLEKQEGSIKSQLIAPVTIGEILLAKVIASLLMSLVSPVLVILVTVFIQGIEVNVLLLFLYVLITVFSHTAIGYVIILNCKDFGMMIGYYAFFVIVFYVPSILFSLNIIPERFETVLYISPSQAAQTLIDSVFVNVKTEYLLFSVFYLLTLGFVLYFGYVYKKFRKYAIEG